MIYFFVIYSYLSYDGGNISHVDAINLYKQSYNYIKIIISKDDKLLINSNDTCKIFLNPQCIISIVIYFVIVT